MKLFIILMLACTSLFANAQIATLTPGQSAPAFALQNVDNKVVSFTDYPDAKGFIVVFTCNTCPYAKAYEQRIIALHKKYSAAGFPVLAINPNDPQASPGDSFEKMKVQAKKASYPFPYLYDKGQQVTTQYGAKNTPQVFLIAKTDTGTVVAYTGAIDNDTPDTNTEKTKYVEDAIAALLKNEQPAVPLTKAIGCTVRWKKG